MNQNLSALSNARHPGESFKNYRARRTLVNRNIKAYLRGKFAHVSSEAVQLPVSGVDVRLDHAILARQYVDVTLITLKNGTQMRVGRTKGKTFMYADREAHRAEVLAKRHVH